MLTFELPWPPKVLKANNQGSWRGKVTARRGYKEDCFEQSRMLGKQFPEGNIPVKIIFHPPDRKRRDLDNMLASFKLGLDGVAAALRVDDVRFRPMFIDVGEPVKNGKIMLTLGYYPPTDNRTTQE